MVGQLTLCALLVPAVSSCRKSKVCEPGKCKAVQSLALKDLGMGIEVSLSGREGDGNRDLRSGAFRADIGSEPRLVICLP